MTASRVEGRAPPANVSPADQPVNGAGYMGPSEPAPQPPYAGNDRLGREVARQALVEVAPFPPRAVEVPLVHEGSERKDGKPGERATPGRTHPRAAQQRVGAGARHQLVAGKGDAAALRRTRCRAAEQYGEERPVPRDARWRSRDIDGSVVRHEARPRVTCLA